MNGKTSYVRKWGYSLQEIGDHMGIGRSRVLFLIHKNSPRIKEALKEMKAKSK